MINKIKEYSLQLEKKIEKLEKQLEEAYAKLEKSMEDNPDIILEFGLAKHAENITKIHAQLNVLYDQQSVLNSIFKTELKID